VFPRDSHSGSASIVAGTTDYVHPNQSISSEGDAILIDLGVSNIHYYYDVVYLGWDRRFGASNHGATVGIHHPAGDVKKISFENNQAVEINLDHVDYSSALEETPGGPINAWRVNWDSGITEGGSSGHPLLDNDKIIGVFTGGTSGGSAEIVNCNITGPDYYMHMGYIWDKADITPYSIGEKLTNTPATTTTMNAYYPPALDPSPGGSGNPGNTECPYFGRGIPGNPTIQFNFNSDVVGQCLTSWETHSGTIQAACIPYTANAINRAALMVINDNGVAEMSKKYTFYPDRDYTLTIKIGTTGENVSKLGKLSLRLKTSVPPTHCPNYWAGIGVMPDDQVLMTVTKEQYYLGANQFYTFAVKFRPTQQFHYLVVKYSDGVDTPNVFDGSYIYVDDVFLYQDNNFVNNNCYDDRTIISLQYLSDPTIMSNRSLTLKHDYDDPNLQALWPTVEAGHSLEVRSKLIVLKPGFLARPGSVFHARPGECIENNVLTGPLETPNNSALIRTSEDLPLPDPTLLFNYYDKENIYRTDLFEASSETKPVIIDEPKIILSPNPTKGRINGRFITEADEIPYTIFDSYGRELTKGVSGTTFEFDLGAFSEGIYILKATLKGKNHVARIVLKK